MRLVCCACGAVQQENTFTKTTAVTKSPYQTNLTVAVDIKRGPYRLDRLADGIDRGGTGRSARRRRRILLRDLEGVVESSYHLFLIEGIGRISVVEIEPRVRIGEGWGQGGGRWRFVGSHGGPSNWLNVMAKLKKRKRNGEAIANSWMEPGNPERALPIPQTATGERLHRSP